jgi:hypothetical protein
MDHVVAIDMPALVSSLPGLIGKLISRSTVESFDPFRDEFDNVIERHRRSVLATAEMAAPGAGVAPYHRPKIRISEALIANTLFQTLFSQGLVNPSCCHAKGIVVDEVDLHPELT